MIPLYHRYFPTYIHLLERELKGMKTILELGCGKGSPLKHVKVSGKKTGVDISREAVLESMRKKIHSEYIVSDVFDINLPDNSYEAVIALDLIEHFPKEDGYKLIELMKRLATKKVIIFTPNGFVPQGEIDGNEFQEHKSGWDVVKSGWDVVDVEKLGFEVYGVNGLKHLRGERAEVIGKPRFLYQIYSEMSQLYTYKRPEKAYALFAVYMKYKCGSE